MANPLGVASPDMEAVFLDSTPRVSIPRAKSFAFASQLSKLSECVDTTNTYVLEIMDIVIVLVTWLLLSE